MTLCNLFRAAGMHEKELLEKFEQFNKKVLIGDV